MQHYVRTFAGIRPGGALAHSEVEEALLDSEGNRRWHGQRAGSPPVY